MGYTALPLASRCYSFCQCAEQCHATSQDGVRWGRPSQVEFGPRLQVGKAAWRTCNWHT